VAELLNRKAYDLWPVDRLILGYLGAATVIELAFWSRLPNPMELLTVHIAGILLIGLMVMRPANPALHFFHYWYPLFYVFYCYKEMSILIPALRTTNADAWLAELDLRIWGANPTVWLERLRSPVLVEMLVIIYSGFVPCILLMAFIMWKKQQFDTFRYYAFLIALGFLTSYVGYLLVPARGPRFVLRRLQTYELEGLWLFHWLTATLDRIESAHWDCFPSGHTEMTILAWWGSRTISSNLFRLMFVYTLGVVFATVYLRYHYTVDVAAGAIVAAGLIVMAPRLYRALGGQRNEAA